MRAAGGVHADDRLRAGGSRQPTCATPTTGVPPPVALPASGGDGAVAPATRPAR